MNGYIAFLKKEMNEALKTYKLFIMLAVFLIFGLMSPLMAKMTPDIIKWAMESDPQMAGADLSSLITEPTAFESWLQFSQNITQLGLITLVIVFSGFLSTELSKGQLIIILTKGLSRSAVIFAKFTAAVLIWSVCMLASFLTAFLYTVWLFEAGSLNLPAIVFGTWVFGVFLLAVTIFFSAITSKSYTCMLLVGAVSIVLNLINIIPGADKLNPVSGIQKHAELLTGQVNASDMLLSFIAAGCGALFLLFAAVIAFNKRKI